MRCGDALQRGCKRGIESDFVRDSRYGPDRAAEFGCGWVLPDRGDPDPYCHSYADCDRDRNSDSYGYGNDHGDPDDFGDAYSYRDCYRNSDRDADADSDFNGGHRHGYCHSYRHGNRDSHGHKYTGAARIRVQGLREEPQNLYLSVVY